MKDDLINHYYDTGRDTTMELINMKESVLEKKLPKGSVAVESNS